ncbi:hypothetical protein [Methyloceanibacter sp.]|nr:hypothetical protein [Methyloceanibacter sp.]HML92658.1 hypothetical protein [Methyloceanibacter sp.]
MAETLGTIETTIETMAPSVLLLVSLGTIGHAMLFRAGHAVGAPQ